MKEPRLAQIFEVRAGKHEPPPPEAVPLILHTLVSDCVLAITAAIYELRREGQALNEYLLEESYDSVAVNAAFNETISFLRYCIINSQMNVMKNKLRMLRMPQVYIDMHPATLVTVEMAKESDHYIGMTQCYHLTVPDVLDEIQKFINTPERNGWRKYERG